MSNPTTRGKYKLLQLGEGLNSWGLSSGLNGGVFERLDEAVHGVQEITLTSTSYTLTTTNYVENDIRYRILSFSGNFAATIAIPASTENWWIIKNSTGQILTFSNGSNSATLADTFYGLLTTNGTTVSMLTLPDGTNVATVAGAIASVNTVAGDINSVIAVAGKSTEVGRLGTAAAVDDMALLGTTANVTAMAELGTSANVTAQGHLGTAANVTAQGHLGTAANVVAQGHLGTSANVTAMGNLGTSANVTNMANLSPQAVRDDMAALGTSAVRADMDALADTAVLADMAALAETDVLADMAALGDAAVITDLDLLGTTANVTAMGHLGTSANVTAMGNLGTTQNVANMANLGTSANVTNMGTLGPIAPAISTVAASENSVNSFGETYSTGAGDINTRGDGTGSSPAAGDLRFNQTSNKLRVYNAGISAWEDAGSAVSGLRQIYQYVATANQTVFPATGSISYDQTAGGAAISIFLNGVLLKTTDYTATNGTSITLASGAALNDEVTIHTFGTFNAANTYSQSETNTLLAAKAPLASPNFSGTPQISGVDIATTASIPAGGNTVEMVASGTLANGDTVILNADGTVSSVSGVAGGALSTQTFQSSNVYIGSKGTFHSGENKVLIIYRDSGNSSHGKIVAGTVSGNTLSFGTPVTFHGQYTNDMDVAYDVNANLVVIAYESTSSQYGEVRTYSLSGTTFTAQGSPTRWNGTNSSGHVKIQYDPDAQGCVLFYRDISGSNYGKARYVGVSGSSITFGSAVTFEANLVTGIQITYNTTENHHLVIYNRTSGGSTRQAYATVTLSGSTVSNQSSALIFSSDTIGDFDLAHNPTINKVAISCSGQSVSPTAGYIVVGTPSTHAYTWTSAPSGNTRKFSSGSNTVDMTKITYNPDTGKFIVMYRDLTDNYKGKGVEITIDASSNVTVGSTETFFDFYAYYYAPIYDTNADKLVVGYQDQSDGNKGKAAIILFSSSTLTTSNFLGFSDAAYTNGQTATIQVTGNVDDAQTGLTINTTYFVQNDGTLGTSPSAIASVTAGKAIAATKILIA